MRYEQTYQALASFGRELLEKKTLGEGLPLISKYAKNVIKAERCSIFIYDAAHKDFWTTIADGVDKIIIPSDKGIVGHTLELRKPVISNSPYNHPNFLPDIDKETGYITKNVITSPIFSSKREILGVLQLLNKEGDFDDEDIRFMIFFSHYVSGFLELSSIYLKEEEKLKRASNNE